MQLHFRERITLKQLSGISGYSETYFSELFRKTTGQTYIERLQTLRLRYATVLLSNGLRVTDACYESGFGSISSFQVAFKKKIRHFSGAICGVERPPALRAGKNRMTVLPGGHSVYRILR